MALTHTIGITYKSDAGTITSTSDAYTGNAEHNVEVAVPANTTNQLETITIPFATITSFVMYSDVALTVKTNSTGSPVNTFALAAKKQLVWNTDHIEANPITGNITALYLTNASTTAIANFKFHALANI